MFTVQATMVWKDKNGYESSRQIQSVTFDPAISGINNSEAAINLFDSLVGSLMIAGDGSRRFHISAINNDDHSDFASRTTVVEG